MPELQNDRLFSSRFVQAIYKTLYDGKKKKINLDSWILGCFRQMGHNNKKFS